MQRESERKPQERPRYLTQQDLLRRYPDLLPPDCSWREMVARGEVLMPGPLMLALGKAQKFLITEPGPNLFRRRLLAPVWLGYWQGLVGRFFNQRTESRPGFTSSEAVKPFERIQDYVAEEESGVLFVAAAEGHSGHVHAAEFMLRQVTTVWTFERDNYFAVKEREGPFLPLEVRLSMWDYFGINYLTVSPERDPQVDVNTHYNNLFKRLGVTYCFATEGDPDLKEKMARGATASFTVISKALVPSTSERVRPLFKTPTVSEFSVLSSAAQVQQRLESLSSWYCFEDILSDDDLFGI